MSKEVRRRTGTTAEHSTFTGAAAELTIDETKNTVVVHDDSTAGGFPLAREDMSNYDGSVIALFESTGIDDNAASTAITIDSSQGVILIGATGGGQGSGTLNATGLFVNGSPISANLLEDTTPQLGGMLDVNTFGLGDGTNLLLDFIEDASSVNYFQIENEATGSGPILRAVGSDTDIDINLEPKGLGKVTIDSTEFALPSGGITVGSAAGGNQGSGTVNATAYYENGVQLSSTQASFDSDVFTGTGAQTAFTMSRTPIGEDAILVAVSGLIQDGGVDYTVSGTTLTFTTAPPNTAKILVLFRDIFTTGTLVRDNFTGTGSQTAFTLTEDPGVAANLLVFIDGVTQYTPDAYTVSGTTLTFTSAPANTADIQTVQLNTGLASVTPSDSSVTFAKLDSSLQSNFGSNKSVIINGNFDIWQRGTTFTAPASADFTADRWQWSAGGDGVVDIKRSTSVPVGTSDFSFQVDVTTLDTIEAGDFYYFVYKVEGYDAMRFGLGTSDAKNMTLSFWVRSSKTGIHCVAFRNNAFDRNYIVEYTVSVADNWEYKTITLTADTAGIWLTNDGIGVRITWALAIGSTFQGSADTWQAGNLLATSNQVNVLDSTANNFHISQVQLELGSTATNFERRSFATELSMCQRYYHLFGRGVGGLVVNATIILVGGVVSPTMRTGSGTLSLETTTPQIRRTTGSVTGSGSALSSTNTNDNGFETRIDGFTGLTAGHSIQIVTDDTLALDAEL